MRGAIKELVFKDGRKPYGFIAGNDGNRYYFNQESIMGKRLISDFYVDDEVSFTVEKSTSTKDRAIHMKLEKHIMEAPIAAYARPGISKRLKLENFASKFKTDSNEIEVIRRFAEIFQITRVGQHIMDQSSTYEFCLAGVTEHLKCHPLIKNDIITQNIASLLPPTKPFHVKYNIIGSGY